MARSRSRPKAGCAAAILLASVVGPLAPALAEAGEVRGHLRVPSGAPRAEVASAYPGQLAAEPTQSRVTKATVAPTDAVVSLMPKPGTRAAAGWRAPRPPVRHAELRQSHQRFVPRVLPVLVGSIVDFPNDDPFYHNVFSYSSTKRFDLGRYGKGKSSSQTFDQTGLVKVFCDIHSDMAAYVVVLETPHFVAPGSDGGFAIREVPAGDYVVTSWHPDLAEWSGEVTVPAEGAATLEIDMR